MPRRIAQSAHVLLREASTRGFEEAGSLVGVATPLICPFLHTQNLHFAIGVHCFMETRGPTDHRTRGGGEERLRGTRATSFNKSWTPI